MPDATAAATAPMSGPASPSAHAAAPASEALVNYRRSQTFLAKLPDPDVYRLRVGTVVGVLALFFVLIPALNVANVVPDYKLNLLGKYLCFTIVALGVDLIWGYTGLLSLCQAFFFCLGGYAMAMHLSLPQGGGDVRPEYHDIPQFMFFNNVHELPGFWRPFASMPFTLFVGVALPALVAGLFGFFIFRSRVRGVYFTIITQAVAWGMWLLISRNEMLLGGTNGLTNFYKPLTQSRRWILALYFATLVAIVLAYLLCRAIVRSRLGRVLVAIRDKETRLYFAGYRPYAYKVFAFAIAAALAGVGGMLYAPQQGIITPQNMNVEASIAMAILVAVGGRGRLWGSIFGALVVNYAASVLTSDVPRVWPFIYGGLFLAVVLGAPSGVVGAWDELEKQLKLRDWRAVGFIALGLLALVAFVLAEALGLVPAWMQRSLGLNVPVKYVLLAVAAVVSMAGWGASRARYGTRRGFDVAAPAAAR